MDRSSLRFPALYFTRFAGGFGFITLVTLLGKYVDALAAATTVLGVTLSEGFVIGMFTTGFTLAQTAAVVPLAWAGDRYDKRLVLLSVMGLGVVAYAVFPLVDSSLGFIGARALQGVAVTGMGLMSLALVGELSARGTRANNIGKSNSARFAAGILGSVVAAVLYEAYGFSPVFGIVVALLLVAVTAVLLLVPADDTRVPGFPFSDLAVNRRILTITSFRAQYAVAVTLVRTWVPIYAGVSAASGGLALGGLALSATVVAEKFTNMLLQPYTGSLSDRLGRAPFVAFGGGTYGLVALAVPFSPTVGEALGVPTTAPLLGEFGAAFVPLVAFSGLLGVADSFREPASMALFADEGADGRGVASSFGVRELVWRPGSVVAPMLGGWLMAGAGMAWVFWVGGAAALSGVVTFLAALIYLYGPSALTEW